MLEFRILGSLEVSKDGVAIPLGGRKQRALLTLLLLEAGHVVSTDRLIDTLWGERPPRTAATSLQNLVSQLRKLLGPEVLVTKPSGYQLDVAPEQLDLERFRLLVGEARRAPAEARAARLREALSLWRGPPLADFGFESFAQPAIGRLEGLRIAALEERLETDLDTGRHAEVVGELESLVEEHPLREGFRAHLMLALYRSERQAEALQVYQDARRELVDELGIEPSSSLQRLHGAILRQDPELNLGHAAPEVQHRFEEVAATLLSGRVVPVLGADVAQLEAGLAERFGYPNVGVTALPQVAQYVAMMQGSGPLYDELHTLLELDAPPTPVHRFLASLPPLLRERGAEHQLIVSTNYDLSLEQAFLDAGEEFEVVSYIASGRNRGKFCHIGPNGAGKLIELPNTYASELSLERRTIILKLHGQIDRTPEREWESFVVMEDDYIDYPAQAEVAGVVPVGLTAKLRRSHLLFLGYAMADWNLRLLLNRLRGDQPLSYRSWAIQPTPSPLEREFWSRQSVDLVELPLDEYVEALGAHLGDS
jgi:DNA-binding SARP family transcriptional activator